MKKIIAVDFSGTLVREIASDKAHYEWFAIMAAALKDESIKKYAGTKDYFPKIYEVMERYTGLNKEKELDKVLMTKFARNLFQMSFIGMANKLKDKLLVKEFADYLKKLKTEGYEIDLVTTAPEDSVIPILEIVGCEDLFNFIYKSPLTRKPSKYELLNEFIKDKEKPLCYICNENEDVIVCKELEVTSILVTWDKTTDQKFRKLADYVINNVDELKRIIDKLSK